MAPWKEIMSKRLKGLRLSLYTVMVTGVENIFLIIHTS